MFKPSLRLLQIRSAQRAPWSAAVRRDSLFLAAGVPLGLPCLLALTDPKGLWFLIPLAVACSDLLTTAQRSRLRAFQGVSVPGRLPAGAGWGARIRAGLTWRQVGHHLVVAPFQAVVAMAVLSLWGVGVLMATVYAWVWVFPLDGPLRGGPGWSTIDFWITIAGLGVLAALPWLLSALARAEIGAVAVMLGPNRAELLARRVEDLAESRAGVVDAADAERRRIERDLHDGAQQRLVSLAMNLGLARRVLHDIPPEAMQVIVEAHQEAQAAIEELRDLVRGLHPVVLEDRGLDAALSGIAARSPVPVRLSVDLPRRVAPTVEAVAYFTVSEALTNAAKHSKASWVDLTLRQVTDRLHITITDDGVGGADTGRGTGLQGLRQRAASVDGTFAITSPRGGPTTITMELPCEL